jgi:lipoyl-dependent peroxiredoxin subunit D
MSLETLKNALPDYARDTKLNLGKVLSAEGSPDLSESQIHAVALASAYATKQPQLILALESETAGLSQTLREAAKAAATIMGMNNVYYRFLHLVSDKEYSKLPANLRMQVIGNPGVDKVDFELMSLAVSAINGCGMCMDAHAGVVTQAGVSKVGVQSAVRIASVLMAAAQALVIEAASQAENLGQKAA